jgi:nitrite reductase (NADH) large subunit
VIIRKVREMSNDPIVIIGASAAGVSAAREIRSIEADIPIRMLTEERHLPYYRPSLTEYIGDSNVESRSNFLLNQESWYRDRNVELSLGTTVVAIDPAGKTVATGSGETFSYGTLILANGSTPFVPFKDAAGKKNVFSIRTLDDARAANDLSGKVKTAAVIGGGLLGLEAAHALSAKGVKVTVIEGADRILPRQLDAESSLILQTIVTGADVALVLGKSIEAIQGEGSATGVRLTDGEVIPVDMVIISIGVRPNVGIAKDCGIAVNRAVVVNERMETSVPGIYACGDVAEFNGKCISLWMPAMKQGKVAGSNAAGKPAEFLDEVYPAILNSFGTRIYSIGDICQDKKEGEYRVHMTGGPGINQHKKLFFVEDRLVGFILIGDISESQKLAMAVKNRSVFSDVVK